MEHHQNCFLCEHSLPEWKDAIRTHAKVRSFKRGAAIFKEGDAFEGFYFIHQGKVKVHKHWGDEGKDMIMKFAGAGEVLGHRGMSSTAIYPVSATAVEEVNACFISPEFFRTTLLVNHELAYKMVQLYADELQKAEQHMRNIVHRNVKGRIADSLLTLERLFGKDEENCLLGNLSKQDIASFACTTYETLFKVLNEWSEAGIITTAGRQIYISDSRQLLQFID